MTDQQRVNLINRCDAYVSLHRSEGFGLTLGEAMALGKPVIGTGFGGNVDFMTPANSWLVDYEETLVGPEGENYPAHGTWAEPDLDHAAELMREVWEEREEASARAERGPDATSRSTSRSTRSARWRAPGCGGSAGCRAGGPRCPTRPRRRPACRTPTWRPRR